jgi:putative PEP-CTERM system TPR-repeat lipoprotein
MAQIDGMPTCSPAILAAFSSGASLADRLSVQHDTHTLEAVTMRVVSTRLAVIALAALPAIGCSEDPGVAMRRYVESGDRYVASGKYAEAVIEYRNAVQQEPRAGDVRVKLADTYLRVADFKNAVREYARAADLLPADAMVQIKAGSLLLLTGRFEDARARADKVLDADRRNVDAHILKANALAGLKDIAGAIAQVEQALRAHPDRGSIYSNLGALEISRGNAPAAERAFRKATELDPESVTAQLALGNFYWVTGRWAEAETCLKNALKVAPRDALANRAAANFFLVTGRFAAAEAPLRNVFDITKAPVEGFALADYYVGLGKLAAARAVLEPMLNDPRAAGEAGVRLATIDYQTGRRDDAYRRLETSAADGQTLVKAHLVKAQWLLADGKVDEALATTTAVIARDPTSPAAQYVLGRVHSARNEVDAAITAYQEVLRINPKATEARLGLARLHLADGRPDESVRLAREALNQNPTSADARLLMVRGLLARNELGPAERVLNELAVRFPNAAQVHTQMGLLSGRKGNNDAARRHFEKALQLDPDDTEALVGIVALDLGSGRRAEARKRVEERLSSRSSPALLTLAARTFVAAGDSAAAERVLRQAIEEDPSHLPAFVALGQLYIGLGRLDEARAEFESVARRSPKPAAAITMLGTILEASGQIDAARREYERAVGLDPSAAVAANNLAWIYAETGGNLDVALNLAQRAVQRMPDAAQVNDTLGFIFYKKQLTTQAISAIERSVEQDPVNPVYRYHLGLAYAQAGEKQEAVQALSRALDLHSNFKGAQEARDLLTSLNQR